MTVRSWLQSATFRLTLFSAPLYLLGGWALLAFVFFNTQSVIENRVNGGLAAESMRLRGELRNADRYHILEIVNERIIAERGSARLYQVLSEDGTALIGNFTLMSGTTPQVGDFANVWMRKAAPGAAHEARLFRVATSEGVTLILGRDLSEEDQFRGIVVETLWLGAGLTALLAIVVGALISRAVMRRLSGFNAGAQRILHGHIDERLPNSGSDDEFDHLADNLNEALDRISELMAATRQVTDNIAHDLRSPLSHIRNRLEYLQISHLSPDEVEAALAESVSELDSVLETFEALLTIARFEHGGPQQFTRVNLSKLADDLVDYFLPLAEEKDLSLLLDAHEDVMVEADPHLMFQALSNLVDNAIRYTPVGKRIEVSVWRKGALACLRVADNGPGIPAGERESVLKRFVRLDTTRHQPGSGLGLAVVEAIVKHHNAQLELSDNKPGLAVTIKFPALSDSIARVN
ncbi:MAG: ATP-binding protein [Beijerinckiaceae bacterium]